MAELPEEDAAEYLEHWACRGWERIVSSGGISPANLIHIPYGR